ncbi:MAG: hypothetical protein WCA46_29210 [Actinocatenispora sp.]
MIVCLPDDLPAQALTTHTLDRHFAVAGALTPQFWAIPALRLWQRRHLIGPRTGRRASCAGGPLRLLDLDGMRHAAALGAGIRHQLWQRVVHGTRPAAPWHTFHARHQAHTATYPIDRARTDFCRQPRITAIRMHNAATPPAAHLRTAELEMFQAGPMAYQHYTASTAICGDALLTADGHTLAPVSNTFTDRITYLHNAHRALDTLPPDQRLVALAVSSPAA